MQGIKMDIVGKKAGQNQTAEKLWILGVREV